MNHEYVADRTGLGTEQREAYDRGNGAPDGLLIAPAAGLLDADAPETALRRDAARR
jgi:hypothetical protein